MAASTGDGRRPEPTVITNARSGSSQELASRQRQYVIAMGIRTICFLLSTILYFTHVISLWLAGILFVAAVLLPSVAVAIANQSNTRTKDQEKFERGAPTDAHQLTTGPEPEVISGVVQDEHGRPAGEGDGWTRDGERHRSEHVDDRGAA